MLLTWEALATVFALLPAIAALAYLYECGKTRAFPSLVAYVRLVLMLQKAKSEAYKRTAESFVPSSSSGATRALASLLALAVFFIGSDLRFVAAGYILSIILLPFAYLSGRRNTHRI